MEWHFRDNICKNATPFAHHSFGSFYSPLSASCEWCELLRWYTWVCSIYIHTRLFYVLSGMRPMWKINVCSRLPLRNAKNSYPHTHTHLHARIPFISLFVPYESIWMYAEFFVLSSFILAIDYFIVFCAPQIDFDVRPREWVRVFLPTCKMRIDQIDSKSNQIK